MLTLLSPDLNTPDSDEPIYHHYELGSSTVANAVPANFVDFLESKGGELSLTAQTSEFATIATYNNNEENDNANDSDNKGELLAKIGFTATPGHPSTVISDLVRTMFNSNDENDDCPTGE